MKLRAASCALVSILLAPGLRADPARDAQTVLASMAVALSHGDASGFCRFFDSSTPGFARIRRDVTVLVKVGSVESTLEITRNAGNDSSRELEMSWLLQLQQREDVPASTSRRDSVKCQLTKEDGHWRIVRFEPVDLFTPPKVRPVWDLFESAAVALSDGNVEGFLAPFDSSMPGYLGLFDDVTALVRDGTVENSIDLISDSGDDRDRSVELDWDLRLVSDQTGNYTIVRSKRVACRIERRGGQWRIVSFTPLELFGPPRM